MNHRQVINSDDSDEPIQVQKLPTKKASSNKQNYQQKKKKTGGDDDSNSVGNNGDDSEAEGSAEEGASSQVDFLCIFLCTDVYIATSQETISGVSKTQPRTFASAARMAKVPIPSRTHWLRDGTADFVCK